MRKTFGLSASLWWPLWPSLEHGGHPGHYLIALGLWEAGVPLWLRGHQKMVETTREVEKDKSQSVAHPMGTWSKARKHWVLLIIAYPFHVRVNKLRGRFYLTCKLHWKKGNWGWLRHWFFSKQFCFLNCNSFSKVVDLFVTQFSYNVQKVDI